MTLIDRCTIRLASFIAVSPEIGRQEYTSIRLPWLFSVSNVAADLRAGLARAVRLLHGP
jgi:hypothetical protein